MADKKVKVVSAYEPLWVHIRGVVPCLMHNGRMKNPLDRYAKLLRTFSKKKTKTDEDHAGMMEAEFRGSLYCLDDEAGTGIYWPNDNIHACIKTAAKMKKTGKTVDSAVVVLPPGGELIYDGPKTRDGMWADERFRLTKGTRRGTMCCRPKFESWECKFQIRFLSSLLDLADLKSLIEEAGRYVGLSDWPRRYGLFEVVEFRSEEVEIKIKT